MAETLQNISAATPDGTSYQFFAPQLAAEYSAANTYALGDYCVRQGQLYRCTTAITTAEAWNAAHWTAVYIADEVAAQGSGSTEIFWATYGTTTNAEIEAALQFGKIVACDRNGNIYLLTIRVSATNHVFSFINGNTSYQVRCVSDAWASSSISLNTASAYNSTPAALGTASAGSSSSYSRGDHVHQKPSASDVGAIPAPSSPTSGQFLVYDGSEWVAQTVPNASGVSF